MDAVVFSPGAFWTLFYRELISCAPHFVQQHGARAFSKVSLAPCLGNTPVETLTTTSQEQASGRAWDTVGRAEMLRILYTSSGDCWKSHCPGNRHCSPQYLRQRGVVPQSASASAEAMERLTQTISTLPPVKRI